MTLALGIFHRIDAAGAQSSEWGERGTLNCTVGPSIGLVMGARQHARCAFETAPGNSRAYFGRLQKTERRAGLPSGGKLIWTVFAAPNTLVDDITGSYQSSHSQPEFKGRDDYTVCQIPPRSICLRPMRVDTASRGNLASTVTMFRLDTSAAQ